MKTNVSLFDLTNCRIQARIESKQTGRTVTCNQVLQRELKKSKINQPSLVSIHFAVKDEGNRNVLDNNNIGKTFIIEQENSNIIRYTLVLNSNEINPDLNIVSTRSSIGKALRNAKVDEVVIVHDQLWRIIDIIDKGKQASA